MRRRIIGRKQSVIEGSIRVGSKVLREGFRGGTAWYEGNVTAIADDYVYVNVTNSSDKDVIGMTLYPEMNKLRLI